MVRGYILGYGIGVPDVYRQILDSKVRYHTIRGLGQMLCSSLLLHIGVTLFGWRRGVVVSGVRRMNKVNLHRVRLVLGWLTVFGQVYHLGM